MYVIKNKYFIVSCIAVCLLVAGGVGWYILSGKDKPVQNNNTSGVQGASTGQFLSPTSDPNSISLNHERSTSGSSGGLSVSSGYSSNNLGQLTPNSGGTTSGSDNTRNSNSSGSNTVDPSTFAQYDKYKTENNALFGEIQPGTGAELTEGKKAAVLYKGWLTDGRLFDMSRAGKDGKLEPFVFTLGAHQVIPGWEQSLAGMKVGGTRLLIVPPAVGYGAAGQDPIPPNAVLVFQVQLLEVQ